MDLNIFIVLFCTLITGGYSLKCKQCLGTAGSCVTTEMTCPTTLTTCASATAVSTSGDTTLSIKIKGCSSTQSCVNGSVNLGISRTSVSMQCCSTDLCNTQDVPDSSSNSPNGNQCFSCDGNGCSNKLNCLGSEDYCITANANITSLPATLKGCVSKSACDAASQVTEAFVSYSCCQGNLCNSATSITQNLLHSFPFIFYILFH